MSVIPPKSPQSVPTATLATRTTFATLENLLSFATIATAMKMESAQSMKTLVASMIVLFATEMESAKTLKIPLLVLKIVIHATTTVFAVSARISCAPTIVLNAMETLSAKIPRTVFVDVPIAFLFAMETESATTMRIKTVLLNVVLALMMAFVNLMKVVVVLTVLPATVTASATTLSSILAPDNVPLIVPLQTLSATATKTDVALIVSPVRLTDCVKTLRTATAIPIVAFATAMESATATRISNAMTVFLVILLMGFVATLRTETAPDATLVSIRMVSVLILRISSVLHASLA